jgi:hypothetical protein
VSRGNRYRPADPAAYGGRPRLPRSALPGLVLLLGLLAVAVAPGSDDPWWVWLAVLAFAALNLRQFLLALSLPRPRRAPFVVDAPGVWVRDEGVRENEGRLVHWETIAEIVLFRAAAPGSRRLQDAVGLRLRRHPDVVAIRRVLDTWTLDRARLEAAVARYAPGVRVVDGPDDPVATPRTVGTAAAGSGPAPGGRQAAPHGVSGRSRIAPYLGRYRARDPRAYVVRPTWGGSRVVYAFAVPGVAAGVFGFQNGGLPLALVFGGMFTLPFAVHAAAVLQGGTRFAADAPGVYFGTARSGEPPPGHRRVRWAGDRDRGGLRRQAGQDLGARRRRHAGAAGGGEPRLQHWHVLSLDRAALEAAVLRFAPQVPVVDGPPLSRPRPYGVEAFARVEWQRLRPPRH